MLYPSWETILETGDCYLVNLDRCAERLRVASERISAAGFKNIRRMRAVDGATDDLAAAWARHGNPRFANDPDFFKYPGQQGCMLSHLDIWKDMIERDAPFAVVFEDDILFHSEWSRLAPMFYRYTPMDFHLLYFGCQMEYKTDAAIVRAPLFCTHAYMITLEGAKQLYHFLLNYRFGVRTIDCMLYEEMKAHVYFNKPLPFAWYAWNAAIYPDKEQTANFTNPHWNKRNSGLVFQDEKLGTFIKPRENEGAEA